MAEVTLSRAAKMRASRAIESVHVAYHEKDGIRQLELVLDEKRGAAARHVYALAVFASEQHTKRPQAIALFLAMCAYAEAQYKAEHEVANLKDALPTWAVFKSNILRGVREYGLNPRDHRSEGAFRIAMQKAEPAERDTTTRSNVITLPAKPHVADSGEIDKFLATTAVRSTLQTLLSQIIFECETLKAGNTKQAEAVLRDTMNKLAPLVDQQKVA